MTGQVAFDLYFVKTRHRYYSVLYCMCTASYNANMKCIVPGSVKTTGLFSNTMGDHEHEHPKEIVFSESAIEVLEKGNTKLVNDIMPLTMFTLRLDLNENYSTSTTIKLCYQMSKITSDLELHSSSTPIGNLLVEVPKDIHSKIERSKTSQISKTSTTKTLVYLQGCQRK